MVKQVGIIRTEWIAMTTERIVWDDTVTRPALPPLSENITADLVIVGLGGSGLTAAVLAAQSGLSVVGIDSGRIAAGAAGRNGGFLLAGIASFHHDARQKHGRDRAVRMYQHSLEELDRLEQMTPSSVRRDGVLRIAIDADELRDCEIHRDALREDGFAVEDFSGKQGDGLLITSDGVFHPASRAVELARQAVDAGARLYCDTPATLVEAGRVTTPHGVIEATHVLVAVDGKLDRVLPSLTGEVRTTRLQMMATGPNPDLVLEYPVYARYGYDYWQQLSDGSVAMGGGRDKDVDNEWTESIETTDIIQSYIEQRLRGIGATAPITHSWAASVSYTDTGLPLVREVFDNVWAIGGYCGTGNIIGALLGRGVVQQITTGSSQILTDFSA